MPGDRKRAGTRTSRVATIDGDRHQQPRGVGRRLHILHPKSLEHSVATLGQNLLECLGHLVAELQGLAIQPLLSAAGHGLTAGMGFDLACGSNPSSARLGAKSTISFER